MAEMEKAKDRPTTEILSIPVRLKEFLIKSVNKFGKVNNQVREKARIIFKKTEEMVIRVGVLVSCQEKKARIKRGIRDWAKTEQAKSPKQVAVNFVSRAAN